MCDYHGCKHRAKYFMGWLDSKGEKQWGVVCATHDKMLGRENLKATGMTLQEAIAFEKYAKETEE